MQPLFYPRVVSTVVLVLRAKTGQIVQVRNHSKIYPWRSNRSNRECYLDNTETPYTDKNNINEFKSYKRQKKNWQIVIPKDKDNRFNAYKWNDSFKSDPKEACETARGRLDRFQNSLYQRGAARESKPYSPPEGVQEIIIALFKSIQLGSDSLDTESDAQILSLNLNQSRGFKYTLLTRCIKKFNHDLPTSYLNDIELVKDLVEYYSTPVRGVNPYTAMLRKDDSLPVNLSLISEPIRFDKENDQFFQGFNAMPGIVSSVPGLRGSKKYKLLNQDEFQWPDI